MNSKENLGCWLCLVPAIVAMLLLLDSGLNAQQAKSSWATVAQAKGQSITVVRNDNRSQTGQLEQTSSDSLTLANHERSTVVARDDVREVYARTSRSRMRGVLWGLAIGGGGGAITGAAIVQPCSSSSFCIVNVSRGEGAAVGAVAGAVVGTLVGALAGGGHKKALLYERAASASQP